MMKTRLRDAERQGREPRYFGASPDVFMSLKQNVLAATRGNQAIRLLINKGEPTRVVVHDIPVILRDEWAWGWMLFDSENKAVDTDDAV